MRLAALWLCAMLGAVAGADPSPRPAVARVMIVHSYQQGNVTAQPQHDGVLAALAEASLRPGQTVELSTFYMDTKHTYVEPDQIEQRGRLALAAVEEFGPDVLVVLDDNAVRTVMLPLVGKTLPIVFSGMNELPEAYNDKVRFMATRAAPGRNVTGVHECLHLAESLRVLSAVLPRMKRVLAIVDDSPTGVAVRKRVEYELRQPGVDIRFDVATVGTMAEFQELILERVNRDADLDAIYPVVMRLRGDDGRILLMPEVLAWQVEHCRKPSAGLSFDFVRLGMLGGASVDFHAMGVQAGRKVVAILAGRPAGEIPIEDARDFAITFNLARAEALGVEIPFELLGAADRLYRRIEAPVESPTAKRRDAAAGGL
jgi:putative ABC transport system substrate-binding protein